MKAKRVLSTILAAAMLCGMTPATFAKTDTSLPEADKMALGNTSSITSLGDAIYTEPFEDGATIKADMLASKNGWKIVGDNYGIDTGNGFGTGSNAIRFSNTNWGTSNSVTLDLKQSATAKGVDDGVYTSLMANNPAICFQYIMDADFGGFQDGSRSILELQGADGKGFMALEAYTKNNASDDITLNLIALNAEKTENVRYELAKGKSQVFKAVHSAKVYVDTANNAYQLAIDSEAVNLPSHGEWIPVSTTSEIGRASQRTTIVPQAIKIDNKNANWYGGVVLDTLSINNWQKVNFVGEAESPIKPMSMWYRTPAQKWAESLPLGNGRVGAMVWGDVLNDTVSLNDVTAWSGEDHKDKNLDKDNTNAIGQKIIKDIQDELKKPTPDQGKLNTLLQLWGGESNKQNGTHRPFGKLNFKFKAPTADVENYRRSLDLQTAVSSVDYKVGTALYNREAFVSNPDQVMAMKYTATESGKITFDVNFGTEDINGGKGTTTAGADYLAWNGEVHNQTWKNNETGETDAVENPVKTFAYLKAIPTGGSVTYDADGLHVKDADEVSLVLSLGTDFTAGKNFPQNSVANCKSQLDAAVIKGYDALKTAHVNDVQPRFDKMVFEIGAPEALRATEPVDVRLNKIREGGEVDGSFMSLWYQYARYLMIAGSRENSPMPMNLQGIWNDNVACNMAWTCDYHLDINVQMNQWMSNSSNLSEGEMPIFNFMENILIPNGEVTAAKQYGTKAGWVSSIMTNAWGYTGNTGEVGAWHGNTTCGAWLAQEIMNYFSHTWDKTFLETRGYPMLKSTADFYMEFLTEYTGMDGKTYWVMAPSSSPEHGQIEMMSTMEITVIKDIFTQILKCYDILGKPHDAYYDSVNVKMQALAPYTVMPTGNMAEWQFNPKDDGNTNHRHTSHLLGLFPYAQITPDKTPDLARASLVSMERRFDRNDFEHTEWTAVNAQGMYARLKDGKSAYDYLKLEGDTFTWPNLLSISPEGIALAPCDVYIIDGTFGVAQATDEMLLQSHSDRLEFLPALPKEWSMGNIKGNSAEGAFDVDFTWEDYTLKSAKILSKAGNKVNILKNGATNWSNVSVYKKDGENLTPVEVTSTVSLLSFDTVQGGEYVIMTDDKTELKTGRMINNTDPRIRYSGFNFNAPRVANDYLKDAHYAELADSTIEYEFTGTGFDVIGETDNAGSAFEVYVDGVKHGDGTSLTANPNAAQQTVYSVDGLTYGKHAVKVVKKAGQYLVFDAFRIRGQYFSYINDDSPQITYGEGWSRGTNRDPKFHDFMGDIYYSDNTIKNAVATINFEGTGIELLAEKNGVYGKMEVELDGTVMDTVNQGGGDIPEGGNAGTSVVWAKDGLSNSEHVLKIKNLGDGGWGWISLDGAVVTNDGGADFNAGVYQLNDLKTGELLDVKNNNMVKTLDLEGSAKQKWSMQYADDTYFRLINAYSGKAITIDNKSNAVQGDVDLNNQTQLWQIVKCTTKEGGVYLVNKTNSQCLQINGGEYSGDGGSLGLYPYEGFYRKHYKWEMSNAGNGLVMFENGCGTMLQADASSPTGAGTDVMTWRKMAGDNRNFKIEHATPESFTITHTGTNKEVAVVGGSTVAVDKGTQTSNKWKVLKKKESGAPYVVFTNVETGTNLSIGGTENWRISQSSVVADAKPYANDIKMERTANPTEEFKVTYTYDSAIPDPEGNSTYNVYMGVGPFGDFTNNIATGTTKAADGFVFTPTNLTPEMTIVIEIIPTSVGGNIGSKAYTVISPKGNPDDNFISNQTIIENFDEAGLLNTIKTQGNGWYHGGSTYTPIVEDKGEKKGCVGIKADNWWANAYLGVEFTNAGNKLEALSGKVYLETDIMFDIPNYNDKDSTINFDLKSQNNNKMATIRSKGETLDLIALNETGTALKAYNIASGFDNIGGKWFNLKYYIDTDTDLFAISINNEFMRADDGGIWFICGTDTGRNWGTPSSRTDVTAIERVEVGLDWMSSGSKAYIDDIKLGQYTIAEPYAWQVMDLSINGGKLNYGEANNVHLSVMENRKVENGIIMVALYGEKTDTPVAVSRYENVAFDSRGMFEQTVSLNVPPVGGNYTIKAFSWTPAMEPLAKMSSITSRVESPFSMSNVFSNNMILQADTPAKIWGKGLAGTNVKIKLYDTNAKTAEESTTVVGADGTWETPLQVQTAGGDYTLSATCGDEVIEFKNVTFGDLYLLAGQSNMEYWMSGLADTSQDLDANREKANNPNIRHIDLLSKGTEGAAVPSDNLPNSDGETWKKMTYESAKRVSQIGYYFAQELNADTGRPIGLISTAVGGSPIKDWLADGTGKLYNNRVYPCRNLEISGILYYQGESDENRSADDYSNLMAGVINDYRTLFGKADLPFYFAQLARYSNQNFEKIRAAQVWTMDKAANKNNLRLISTLDEVGNKGTGGNTSGNARHDIHPYGKAEIARRFALNAKKDIYGKVVKPGGPMYKSMTATGNKVELTFDCTGSLSIMPVEQYGDYKTTTLINNKTLDPTILNGFEIAGADDVYKPAKATINGNKVELTNSEISTPLKARYAYGAYPESPNLTDETGLPSYTFVTDFTSK